MGLRSKSKKRFLIWVFVIAIIVGPFVMAMGGLIGKSFSQATTETTSTIVTAQPQQTELKYPMPQDLGLAQKLKVSVVSAGSEYYLANSITLYAGSLAKDAPNMVLITLTTKQGVRYDLHVPKLLVDCEEVDVYKERLYAQLNCSDWDIIPPDENVGKYIKELIVRVDHAGHDALYLI